MSQSPKSSKRVAIIGISHESNTFIPTPTTLDHFRNSTLLQGQKVIDHLLGKHHEISGFLHILEEEGIEAVPILYAITSPWGKVSDEALDTLWGLASEGLKQAGPIDGVLAAPHGAGVNASRHDMDGWWLARLREQVGSAIPVISTMDPHANFTPAMAAAVNTIIAYEQNPHLDQRARGEEAARLMARTLRGEIFPVCAGAYPPIAINIERQHTGSEPMLTVRRELERVRQLPGVLSASITLGFPYADVPEMGTAFVVSTDNDPARAAALAQELADWLIERRELFRGVLIPPEEAFAAIADAAKPVGLLDMGDNVGGGAPADSTVLARLLEETGRYKGLVAMADAESVQAAHAAGEGSRIRLRIGGKLPMTPAPPLDIEVEVVKVSEDGKYIEPKPRHGGQPGGNMGPIAIVRSDAGVTYLLTTRRVSNSSAMPFISRGLNPCDFDVILIKGAHAPRGAFEELCPTLIRVNTPGVTTADMDALTYQHRRTPLYPFEEIG